MQNINNPERLLINALSVDGEEVSGYAVFSDYDSKWYLGESGIELDPNSITPFPRQISKKDGAVFCPNCNTQLGGYDDHDEDEPDPWHNIPHCPWCGQRLEWEPVAYSGMHTCIRSITLDSPDGPRTFSEGVAYLRKIDAAGEMTVTADDGTQCAINDALYEEHFLFDAEPARKRIYTVRIEQTLEGFVEIEAISPEKAEAIARDLYVSQGKELPQMDDCCEPLHIHVVKALRHKDREELDRMFDAIRQMEITPFGYILDFLIEQGLTLEQATNWIKGD